MNKILTEIQKTINKNMAMYLPHVKNNDLEKNGAIFYMNGQNGTEFDWYVNDRLPYFMMFYNDKDNLGAAKLMVCNDGEVQLYLYDEKGKKHIKTVKEHVDIDEAEFFKLAAVLTCEADNKKIWDDDIESINTDIEITDVILNEFCKKQKDYAVMKNRKNICKLSAIVSKKITDEGWKVGYMERNEPHGKDDSGWYFASGNEDDKYLSNSENFILTSVLVVWQKLDSDIIKYIDMPIGTALIRISPKDFEVDKGDKEIYVVKR